MSNYVVTCKQILAPEALSETRLWLANGEILAVGDWSGNKQDFEPLDFTDLTCCPGLIDLQVNGSPDCNFWADPSESDLTALRLELARCGVTSFLPTLITAPLQKLIETRDFLKAQGAGQDPAIKYQAMNYPAIKYQDMKYQDKVGQGASTTQTQAAALDGNSGALARMPGLHLEGPCLSPQRPGVHPAKHIQPLSPQLIDQLIDSSISLITAALEQDTDGSNQDLLQNKGVKVSLGHSDATFEEANRSFERGAKLLTHTFNALPPLHHRTPGAVGAALLDRTVSCCLIADGLHLAPAICDLIYRLKGVDKTILVTDRATVGTLNGGLVGASIILDDAVRNFVHWNICTLSDAIQMASTNPAKALGISNLGQIKPGMLADLAFFDDKLICQQTIIGGALVSR